MFAGEASFTGPKRLKVGDDEISADRFVLAAGSRPLVPDVPGLAEVRYFTSDTVMRLDALPKSMVVLGGGYIAAEMSHIFGALGTKVTIITRGKHLLSQHDVDVRTRFTELYQGQFDVRLEARVQRVSAARRGIRVELATPAGPQAVDGDALLVATGRTPNSDRLNVAAAGLEVDEHGHVRTDDTYATNVEGIWAFGDLANHFQLKHMANAEARLIRHNLLHPDDPSKLPFAIVPSAVFADPQVASVGKTEQAITRIRAVSGRVLLSSAQLALAREYGFASWATMKLEVESRDILNSRALSRLTRLLARHPDLAVTQMEH